MKLKKEYVILISVVIVLGLYLLISGNRNKLSYDIPKLEKAPVETITKIEISQAEKKIILDHEDDKWKITSHAYPADPTKMKDMLEVIQDLTLTELAAEKKDYQRYELDDEKKITVKVYVEEDLVREFDIGKTSSTYNHTFVRLSEDTRVFYARGSFRSKFEHGIMDLRDKAVLTFDKNEATEIKITKDEQTLMFAKKVIPMKADPGEEKEEEQPSEPSEEEAWVTPSGEKGKKSEIDSIVSRMADLRCDDFLEDKNKEDFEDAICTVTVKGIKEYALWIFPKEDKEGGKYPSVSSENPYPFLLSTYQAESFMKNPGDLIESKEEE